MTQALEPSVFHFLAPLREKNFHAKALRKTQDAKRRLHTCDRTQLDSIALK
jgi:hypothetical protein